MELCRELRGMRGRVLLSEFIFFKWIVFKKLFFNVFERQRERIKNNFSICWHTAQIPQELGLCQAEPGDQNPIWVSRVSGMDPTLEPSPAATQSVHQQEAGWELGVEPRDFAIACRAPTRILITPCP